MPHVFLLYDHCCRMMCPGKKHEFQISYTVQTLLCCVSFLFDGVGSVQLCQEPHFLWDFWGSKSTRCGPAAAKQ